jgi:hypothetical protein
MCSTRQVVAAIPRCCTHIGTYFYWQSCLLAPTPSPAPALFARRRHQYSKNCHCHCHCHPSRSAPHVHWSASWVAPSCAAFIQPCLPPPAPNLDSPAPTYPIHIPIHCTAARPAGHRRCNRSVRTAWPPPRSRASIASHCSHRHHHLLRRRRRHSQHPRTHRPATCSPGYSHVATPAVVAVTTTPTSRCPTPSGELDDSRQSLLPRNSQAVHPATTLLDTVLSQPVPVPLIRIVPSTSHFCIRPGFHCDYITSHLLALTCLLRHCHLTRYMEP